MNKIVIDIEPNTKPRMTQADKWKKRKCVVQYRNFCDELRLKSLKFKLSSSYSILFEISMPKSWSKKKRDLMRGKPHQETPDLDNLIKAVNDALLDEDKIIYQISASKSWADFGKITITNKKIKKQTLKTIYENLMRLENLSNLSDIIIDDIVCEFKDLSFMTEKLELSENQKEKFLGFFQIIVERAKNRTKKELFRFYSNYI